MVVVVLVVVAAVIVVVLVGGDVVAGAAGGWVPSPVIGPVVAASAWTVDVGPEVPALVGAAGVATSPLDSTAELHPVATSASAMYAAVRRSRMDGDGSVVFTRSDIACGRSGIPGDTVAT